MASLIRAIRKSADFVNTGLQNAINTIGPWVVGLASQLIFLSLILNIGLNLIKLFKPFPRENVSEQSMYQHKIKKFHRQQFNSFSHIAISAAGLSVFIMFGAQFGLAALVANHVFSLVSARLYPQLENGNKHSRLKLSSNFMTVVSLSLPFLFSPLLLNLPFFMGSIIGIATASLFSVFGVGFGGAYLYKRLQDKGTGGALPPPEHPSSSPTLSLMDAKGTSDPNPGVPSPAPLDVVNDTKTNPTQSLQKV